MYRFEQAEALEFMRGLGEKSIDHVITDPPYSEHVQKNSRPASSLPDAAVRKREFDFAPLDPAHVPLYCAEFARLARRWVLVFCNVELVHLWREGLEGAGLRYVRTGIWVKENPPPQFSGDRPGVGYECYVLAHPPGRTRWNGGGRVAVHRHLTTPIDRSKAGAGKRHPAEKPLSLLEELVALYSDPGETILDVFAGSGTHGVAALRLRRRFVGCEVQRHYYELARGRLEAAAMVQGLL